jgi:hypothetical protein
VGSPLWREDGFVYFSSCWASPAQSFSGSSSGDSWPFLKVSNLRFPQSGGPGSCIYFPQKQGIPVTPPGIGFILSLQLRSSKFEVTLWPTVTQSVRLGVEHPCGTCDQILLPVGMLLSEIWGHISVGRLLWREDGSAICSAITQWSESRRTRNHTLLSHLRLPQPRRPGSRIYIPKEQGGQVIPSGIGFPLRRLLRLAGLRWRYSNPPSGTGLYSPKSKSRYDRRSVNQYVLVPSPRGLRGAPYERISIRHQEGYIKAKFFMLPFRGLHVEHAVQRGICWVVNTTRTFVEKSRRYNC